MTDAAIHPEGGVDVVLRITRLIADLMSVRDLIAKGGLTTESLEFVVAAKIMGNVHLLICAETKEEAKGKLGKAFSEVFVESGLVTQEEYDAI